MEDSFGDFGGFWILGLRKALLGSFFFGGRKRYSYSILL